MLNPTERCPMPNTWNLNVERTVAALTNFLYTNISLHKAGSNKIEAAVEKKKVWELKY